MIPSHFKEIQNERNWCSVGQCKIYECSTHIFLPDPSIVIHMYNYMNKKYVCAYVKHVAQNSKIKIDNNYSMGNVELKTFRREV